MSFKIRTTKPGKGNKYYIRKANGGYSNAIKGSPTDKECNVLSNCVGYAYGRFNEIGGYGYCKYLAPVNAEKFMDYKGSCKTGQTPKAGAIMVWHGNGGLAGHVAFVERVDNNTQVYTSESDYGGKPFFNKTRNKGSNGNWGLSTKNYKFLGFIYNPAVKETTSKSVNTKKDSPTVTYLANKNYKGSSIVDALKQIKVNSSYSYRSKLAAKNGIKNYTGTPAQNTKMLNLLKKGKLIKA